MILTKTRSKIDEMENDQNLMAMIESLSLEGSCVEKIWGEKEERRKGVGLEDS